MTRPTTRTSASGLLSAPAIAGALFALFAASCDPRELPIRDPVYADVAPLFDRACASCHGPERAEAGYRVDAYIEAIACPDGAESAVEPPEGQQWESAPILSVLDSPDHAGLLTDTERALVRAWVEVGAPARVGSAHPAGWVDPRSRDFHGRALRAEGWARMFDEGSPGACARCHEGAPNDGGFGASAATPCTSCHRDEGGALACSTCHGASGRAHPPRDPCWHRAGQAAGGAHATHVAAGFDCTLCHAERTVDQLRRGGTEHGDGLVQIALDPARAGEGAAWNGATRTCATSCHDRGGSMPVPGWNATLEARCDSCHTSPPADHYAGACNLCHAEAAADARSLSGGPLHANGRVDLGDGSGGCGACHGEGVDPMPRTGSHAAHIGSSLSAPLACDDCHAVPNAVGDAGHLDATLGAEVRFGALASARGASPSFDGLTCSDVACHGAGLGGGTHLEPRWGAIDGRASLCGACHGVPPPAPHTALEGCSSTSCHGGFVGPGPRVTETGRAVHVNGMVDLWR